MELTAQRLRELIQYEADTGVFKWKPRGHRAGNWCNAPREPGSVSKQTGYRAIRVDKKLYQAHRLAWLFVHGCWPASDIDHINGNKLDNRIGNLRDVSNAINRQNTKRARVDSETGFQGVTMDKRRGRYMARIRVDHVAHYIGTFTDAAEANAAYIAAKRRLHVGCTI